jgi:hypothetical protein
MNNYAIFTIGLIFGGFLGMAALSLLYSNRALYWHRFRSAVFSAVLALDKGDNRRGRDILHAALYEVEYE